MKTVWPRCYSKLSPISVPKNEPAKDELPPPTITNCLTSLNAHKGIKKNSLVIIVFFYSHIHVQRNHKIILLHDYIFIWPYGENKLFDVNQSNIMISIKIVSL